MTLPDPRLIYGSRRSLSGAKELELRLRVLLETRPGDLPHLPDFGLDVDHVIGHAGAQEVLDDFEWRVRQAVARWLPRVEILHADVSLEPPGRVFERALGGTPEERAERQLLTAGSTSRVLLRLVARTDQGVLHLQLPLGGDDARP